MKRILFICILFVGMPTQAIFGFLLNVENKREAIITRVQINAERKFSNNLITRPFAAALVNTSWTRFQFENSNYIETKTVSIADNSVTASLKDLDGLVHQARCDVTRWRRWGISLADGIVGTLLSVIPVGIMYGASYVAFATSNTPPVVGLGINKDLGCLLGRMGAVNNVLTDKNITAWSTASRRSSSVTPAASASWPATT